MKLIFERENGANNDYISNCDVPHFNFKHDLLRNQELSLPQIAESEISRHYTALSREAYGVNCGFYPLGSCTMKYNPKINEAVAALDGFTGIHPLQPENTTKGACEVLALARNYLCEITGMDNMTLQPAAGAHGEFTGLLLIKAYHEDRGDYKRKKIIIPDSAHGTNPASVTMAGFNTVNISSGEDGCVDLDALYAALDDETAGLMLTNPNTLGIFDKNILKITEAVHNAGALTYYDGANLNAIMGIVRPGDMGFDVIHLNLHKTFSTPHGGGGPGSGPVGCKQLLAEFLPEGRKSIGRVKSFYGNFLVVLKALTYILCLGGDGLKLASQCAVLNANYMLCALTGCSDLTTSKRCMHEFVLSLEKLKKKTGVSAMDIAKSMIDHGIHPPTMYFPLIVSEALMFEPTETETKETLDKCIEIVKELIRQAESASEELHCAPSKTIYGRTNETGAARNPILKYE